MSRKRFFAALGLVLILSAWATANDTRYYEILLKDKLIGYASEQAEVATWQDRKVNRIRATTALKFAVLGKQRTTQLESVTYIDPKNDRVVFFELTSSVNGTASHLECICEPEQARIWTFDNPDNKGEPTTVSLSPNWQIMSGNNFSHWQRIVAELVPQADAANNKPQDAQTLALFLPETKTSVDFQFASVAAKELQVLGKKVRCYAWRAPNQGILVYRAPKLGFVRMDLPAQETIIRLTDANVVKLADKASAEEVMIGLFAKSNVLFDDYAKVSFLKADIVATVIGSGVTNPSSILQSPMQSFNGDKVDDSVVGSVEIHSSRYDGSNAPPFSSASKPSSDSAEHVQPEALIESDDKQVIALSKELTKGAKDRWQATQSIANWVHKEIRYTIADTPSAKLCLKKREGDCGPHSTLTVAMLRAAGIPSKLVGGVMYTPSFGGTFGQHAWVEVFMGPKTGWITIDPTTGETATVSATHIKLFEGMGGATVKSINVVAFDPPNQKTAAKVAKARPLTWELGHDYTFHYLQGDKSIGKETIQLTKKEQGGKTRFELTSQGELAAGAITIKSTTTLLTADNALPITFHRELDVDGKKTIIKCDFQPEHVQVKISGSVSLEREIPIQKGTYCFDNNLMGCFMLICSQLELKQGEDVVVTTYHPSSLQIIKLTFKPEAIEKVKIGDQEVECFRCEIAPIKNTFWITRDGRFVKAAQGGLVIQLQP